MSMSKAERRAAALAARQQAGAAPTDPILAAAAAPAPAVEQAPAAPEPQNTEPVANAPAPAPETTDAGNAPANDGATTDANKDAGQNEGAAGANADAPSGNEGETVAQPQATTEPAPAPAGEPDTIDVITVHSLKFSADYTEPGTPMTLSRELAEQLLATGAVRLPE